MESAEDVVIVGGGPAGAYCAFELAKKGILAVVFDHSHPREKPCGGGISPIALEKFPFLKQFRAQGNTSDCRKLISCTNMHTALASYEGFNLSRQFLDRQIINMAAQQGVKLFSEKVLNVQKRQNMWQIKTSNRMVSASVLVGADGISSLVRQKTIGAISRVNLGLAYGYYVTGVESEPTTIKFVAELPGYIWIFPRRNHSCIGIGSEAKYGRLFKPVLDNFICSSYPHVQVLSKFAAMLPWVTEPGFFRLPCAGSDWLLLGDAAGHADPLTGEGILYALWSGKLAAEAITKNEPNLYDTLWKEQYGNALKERCKRKQQFYHPLAIEFTIAKYALYQTSAQTVV